MAKGAYIGVSNVARKIKKGYIGVNGVARKIKKAYIGVGGVARPCWTGGEITYYGTIDSLTGGREYLSAASVGQYALFGPGEDPVEGYIQAMDAYNSSNLTKSTATPPTYYGIFMGAGSIGDYALFAGGYYIDTMEKNVYAYSTNLTRSTKTSLTYGKNHMAVANVGNYLLFAAGSGNGDAAYSVDTYDTNLTKKVATDLENSHDEGAAGASVGNYALIAGGRYGKTVESYDNNLTRATRTSLTSTINGDVMGASIPGYALFSSKYGEVNAYNEQCVQTTPTSLSIKRYYGASASFAEHALFAGGYDPDSDKYLTSVDIYDASLTLTTIDCLKTGRCYLAVTSVSNYTFVGGGFVGISRVSDVVDVLTI